MFTKPRNHTGCAKPLKRLRTSQSGSSQIPVDLEEKRLPIVVGSVVEPVGRVSAEALSEYHRRKQQQNFLLTPTGGVVLDPSFICRANDVIFLKLVGSQKDVDDDSLAFHPTFTHQIFKDEKIRGYKNLRIDIYFAEGSLLTFVNISYEDKIMNTAIADDIQRRLGKYLQRGYVTDRRQFLVLLKKEKQFIPAGENLHEYERINPRGAPLRPNDKRWHKYTTGHQISYQITLSKFDTPGFRSYHQRLQFFLLFFIDASSYIDSDDLIWKIMCIFEKRMSRKTKEVRYSLIGYCTLYSFLVFPDSRRLRISQILILPPFQRHGHGRQLLQTIYRYCKDMKYVEVNVEDPSNGFQFLRDKTDMSNCIEHELFQPSVTRSGARKLPYYLKEYSQGYHKTVKNKLKITDHQIHRCFECFKLATINLNDEMQYREYRLQVKKRLNKLFQEELTIFYPDLEEKKKRLAELYSELEAKYKLILEKLKQQKSEVYRTIE